MIHVRTDVGNHLGIVGVPPFKRPCSHGRPWVGNVHGVQSTTRRVGPHAKGKPRILVNHHVVRVPKSEVVTDWGKFHRAVRDVQHLGQVDDLHAMASGLADHKSMVTEYLDVTPQTLNGRCRHLCQKVGIHWVRHLHDGQPIGSPYQQKFTPTRRIDPTPTVVPVGSTSKFINRSDRKQIQPLAGIAIGSPILTRNLSPRSRRKRDEHGQGRNVRKADRKAFHVKEGFRFCK